MPLSLIRKFSTFQKPRPNTFCAVEGIKVLSFYHIEAGGVNPRAPRNLHRRRVVFAAHDQGRHPCNMVIFEQATSRELPQRTLACFAS